LSLALEPSHENIDFIAAFLVAIGILVAVTNSAHYWVAKKLGFKVLRFSIGFGKPLLMRVGRDADRTEYCVAAIPLGGYVKLLDEREGDVSPQELHRSFTRRPVWHRIAVLLAGPAMNPDLRLRPLCGVGHGRLAGRQAGGRYRCGRTAPPPPRACSAAMKSCASALATWTMSRICRLR